MPNIKVVLWSAGSGAAIALVAALFGKVGFLDLVLRTLIGGVAFALLGAALNVILMRFIPEMFEPQETEDEDFTVTASESGREEPAAQQGSNLNIVLDGDEYNYAADEGPEGVSAEANGTEMAEANSLSDEDEEFVEEVEEVEEIGREEPESAESAPRPQANASAQTQGAGSSGGAAGPSSEYKEFEDLSDVDTLPDLEDFSDSFESVAASQEAEGGSSNGGGYSSSDSVDIMGDQQDPATVAKAVRTIIGKDQEG